MNKFTLAKITAVGLVAIVVSAVVTKIRKDEENGEVKIDSGK